METGEQDNGILEGYREPLKKTFSEYLKPFIKKIDPSILSVGCGFGYEAQPLIELFPQASYVGVDINEPLIKVAKRFNADVKDSAKFQVRDARIEDLGKDWDVVILKNPQIYGSLIKEESSQDWEKIIRNSAKAVSEDGVIVVTSDTEAELDNIESVLRAPSVDIVLKERNKFPSKLPHHDYFIMIAKKQ